MTRSPRKPAPVRKTTDAILRDLIGRSGFDGAWDQCDRETRAEIRASLDAIVEKDRDLVRSCLADRD